MELASGLNPSERVLWPFIFLPDDRELKATSDGQPVSLTPSASEVGTWFSHPASKPLRIE